MDGLEGETSRLDEIFADISDSEATAADALGAMSETLPSALTNLSNAFQELFTSFDERTGFVDGLIGFVDGLTDVLTITSDLLGVLPKLSEEFSTLGGAILNDIFQVDIPDWTKAAGTALSQLAALAQWRTSGDDSALRALVGADSDVVSTADIGEKTATGNVLSAPPELAQNLFEFQEDYSNDIVNKIEQRAGLYQQANIDVVSQGDIQIQKDLLKKYSEPLQGQLTPEKFIDIEDFGEQFYRQAEQDIRKEMGLDDKDKLNVKELPFGRGRLPSFEEAVQRTEAEIEKVTGKELEREEVVVALKDGSLTTIEVNQKAMNLVLDQIEENTRDIVRGVFNLPTGADIFVPLQAAENAAGFREEGSDLEIFFRDFEAISEKTTESILSKIDDNSATERTIQQVNEIKVMIETTLKLDGAIIAQDTQERTTSRLNRSSGAFGGATRRVMV